MFTVAWSESAQSELGQKNQAGRDHRLDSQIIADYNDSARAA